MTCNDMVKIAIAGGTGNVAREIIEVLLEKKKHQLIVLTREDNPAGTIVHPDATYVKVDYNDKASLVNALRGIHTVLSFVVTHKDPGSVSQIALIDAAIEAGVKRLAPSEWCSSNVKDIPWYSNKQIVRDYLAKINKDKKVIEYSLFQCGWFANYLAYPHKTTKHLVPIAIVWDFEHCRAITIEGRENLDIISFITVQDLASLVAEAVEFEEEWPVNGGIQANQVTSAQIVKLGEKIRGRPFTVDTVKLEDLKSGNFTTSWMPLLEHPAIPKDEVEAFSKGALGGSLLGIAIGALTVKTDEWNQLLPHHKFTTLEEFLGEVWKGKS